VTTGGVKGVHDVEVYYTIEHPLVVNTGGFSLSLSHWTRSYIILLKGVVYYFTITPAHKCQRSFTPPAL